MDKPVIAFTMGDPSGVGPEVLVKALSRGTVRDMCLPVVIGDIGVITRAAEEVLDMDCARIIEPIKSIDALSDSSAQIPVIDQESVDLSTFRYGQVSKEYGKAAIRSIEEAVRLARAGKVDAIVTPPIQKESFKLAGSPYPGHTEMLAALTNTKNVSLMLMIGNFRVVHVSLHVSLRDAVSKVTRQNVLETIRIANEGCQALGVAKPRIGVCGLNPHAGESGLFGKEEEESIRPAVDEAKKMGIIAEGPMSSDGIFSMLKGGRFDIVVCMYHDQGGIPMKLLAFDWDAQNNGWRSVRGVNVTLGLPIIRTSVAHGTAFEIAGQGKASPDSLIDAIEAACNLVQFRKKKKIT